MNHSATRAIRQHLIETLERRAAGHDGATRRILDEKRTRLVEACASDSGDAAVQTGAERARGPLGALVDRLADDAAPGSHAFPELPALEAFRKTWSGLRTESQLRQTLDYVPENAGPLNSSALVYRSIELMRDLSPGYLRQFLSYLDDLSWIERMTAGGALAEKDVHQPANIGKRARAKPRGRR